MNKKTGLGKGLDALFLAPTVNNGEMIIDVDVDEILPNMYQPRKVFDQEKLQELSDSISLHGVLQPIVLRQSTQGYEIVAGERRWRATKIAKLNVIPAVIRKYSDAEMMEIALIENIQRQDLNVIEEAYAYKKLMETLSLTQEEMAKRLGKSRSMIANTLRLLNLDSRVQEYVSRGTLTMGQVRPLLTLDSGDKQYLAANHIIDQGLNARESEEVAKRQKVSGVHNKQKHQVKQTVFITEVEDKLTQALGTQVKIKAKQDKGKIEVEFYSLEDIERIVDVIIKKNSNDIDTHITTHLLV